MSTENKNKENETPKFSPDSASAALRAAFLELSSSAWDIEKEISSHGSSADLFESAGENKKTEGTKTERRSPIFTISDVKEDAPEKSIAEDMAGEVVEPKESLRKSRKRSRKLENKKALEIIEETASNFYQEEVNIEPAIEETPAETIVQTEETVVEESEKADSPKMKFNFRGFMKGFAKKPKNVMSEQEMAEQIMESVGLPEDYAETAVEEPEEFEQQIETDEEIVPDEEASNPVMDSESDVETNPRKSKTNLMGFFKKFSRPKKEEISAAVEEETVDEESAVETEEVYSREIPQENFDDEEYSYEEESGSSSEEYESYDSYEQDSEEADEPQYEEVADDINSEESLEVVENVADEIPAEVEVKETRKKNGPGYLRRMFEAEDKSNVEVTGLWRTIMGRELGSYFTSPIAYIVTAMFLAFSGFLFFSIFFLQDRAEMRGFFENLPILLSFFIPALTMRLFSEEKKSGSLETLMTLPVTTVDIVLGKYFASLISSLMLLVPTLFYVVACNMFGHPDAGPIWGGYIGAFFLVAAYSAIGLFSSSVTRNQILAFFVAFAICIFLTLVGTFVVLLPPVLSKFFTFISASSHFDSVSRGILDSRDFIYFISVTVFFVVLTVRCLNKSRKG